MYEKAHCPLQKSIQWQLDGLCLNKGDASPSPSIPIPPQPPHPSRVTKVPVWAMVSHGCSIYRRGGVERNHYYMPSELEKSILFFLFYIIIIFFFFYKPEIKYAWERGTLPTHFYSQEHDLTAQAQRFTLGKAPE